MSEPTHIALSAVEHLEQVAALAERLSRYGLTVFYHQYDDTAFGNFVLEIGRPHHRLRFVWDGRDSALVTSESGFQNQTSPASWKECCVQSVDCQSAFGRIESACLERMTEGRS